MNRRSFVQSLIAISGMMTLSSLESMARSLQDQGRLMPVLFVGHGSPMNGIEDNDFSRRWAEMGKSIQQPVAVLCISAHWLTKGTHITAMNAPRTIHDFRGFPKELNEVQYPAPGDPELAKEAAGLITTTEVGLDHEWGLDHGTWSVVRRMFPEADIPVLQLSIDYHQSPQYHYDLAAQLKALRKKGVLIIGSGNIVHNLRMAAWDKLESIGYGFPWAHEFDAKIRKAITERDHQSLIDYKSLGASAELAVPTPDHYYPLLYSMGMTEKSEDLEFFNDVAVGGAMTMTSVKVG